MKRCKNCKWWDNRCKRPDGPCLDVSYLEWYEPKETEVKMTVKEIGPKPEAENG